MFSEKPVDGGSPSSAVETIRTTTEARIKPADATPQTENQLTRTPGRRTSGAVTSTVATHVASNQFPLSLHGRAPAARRTCAACLYTFFSTELNSFQFVFQSFSENERKPKRQRKNKYA